MSRHVTVVIPCHNHRAWILDAIRSAANQSYENKSIVVVDDGSADESYETALSEIYRPVKRNGVVIGSIKNNGTKIAVTRFQSASGPSFARNRGIELALKHFNASVFGFLDSDDMYEPGKLEKSMKYMNEMPNEVGVVYSDYDTLRVDGVRIREFKPGFSRRKLLRECIVNCDSLVSYTAIKECDGFDESMRVCEDYDLWMRISEKFLLIHIPESLVTIRVGDHSSSSNVKNETWKACYQKVFDKLRERAANANAKP